MAGETSITGSEEVRDLLDHAMQVAHGHGFGVIGFVVYVTPQGLDFEPFASSSSLNQDQFVELIALGARGMVSQETVN